MYRRSKSSCNHVVSGTLQPGDLLTAEEAQVALMVWEGLPNRDIAAGNTTAQVIKNYLRNPVAKLGWSRLELAL